MRTLLLFYILPFLAPPFAHSAEWLPTRLTLTADPVIGYAFDGQPLQFTVNVSGTPSKTVFCVFTKDRAENIIDIQNGYLGWHYVNKIDTCIYYNKGVDMLPGDNTVTWPGLDMDGNDVEAGDYTYYLKGYDNVNFKQRAASVIDIGQGQYSTILSQDYNGNPFDRPILYTDPFQSGGNKDHPQPYYIFGSSIKNGQVNGEYVNRMKFDIGGDPDGPSFIEKTWYPVWFEHCQYRPSPYNPDMFYIVTNNQADYTGHMRRYTWVPNGESVHDMDWGEGGEVTWSILTNGNWWVRMSACFEYIGQDQFIGCNTDHSGFSNESELPVVDAIDGFIVRTIDLSEWWIRPQDAIDNGTEEKGQQSSGPNYAEFRMVDGAPLLALTAHSSCLQHVINPHDPDGDYDSWINGNGDYIADHNWTPNDKNPWVCNDYGPPARTYTASLDNCGFVMSSAYEEGAASFHLFAPDGTGIDLFAFQGETAGPKYANLIVQSGGVYDGIYCDNESSNVRKVSHWDSPIGGVWYIAHDSIKGSITWREVSVDEHPTAVFTVKQNTPNPFNPSTTITFSLAEAGNVTVDVYNTAGQQVASLADSPMDAGEHSVIWDASGFAAGMYFCTVRAGASARTIKMTLVK